jgi:hypothetical protein
VSPKNVVGSTDNIFTVSLLREWIQEIKHMMMMKSMHGLFLTCTQRSCLYLHITYVSDREVGCCLEPMGNGVNPGWGMRESMISSQPPAEEETTAGRIREEGSGGDKRTHLAQSEDY